jgi:hypothetical protein
MFHFAYFRETKTPTFTSATAALTTLGVRKFNIPRNLSWYLYRKHPKCSLVVCLPHLAAYQNLGRRDVVSGIGAGGDGHQDSGGHFPVFGVT